MKVALCSCGKLENQYIQEWVSYYKMLGITKIYLYDNNEIYGEHFEDVINNYIISGFVEIVNWRGKKKPQCKIEQDCWNKHNTEYDWICFFDCDEYLAFTHGDKTVTDYLSRECFNGFDIIHINFLAYGDNELLVNDGRPTYQRFTAPLPVDCKGPLPFPNNCHTKSIVRGGAPDINWTVDGHTPRTSLAKSCTNSGIETESNHSCYKINYDLALLKHYSTKTITEYITTKFKRGDVVLESDGTQISDLVGGILTFFSFNKITNQKIDIVKELIKDQYETQHNKIVIDAGGRIGNMLFTIANGIYYSLKYKKEVYVYLEPIEIFKFHDYWLDIYNKLGLYMYVKITDTLDILGPNYVTCYEDNSITYTEIPTHLNSNLYIKGYRQSPKYWENNSSFIQNTFICPDNILSEIYNKYSDIDFNKCISINVRRGDYVGWCEQIFYLMTPDWYINAVNKIDTNMKCLITSDDIDWCKEHFKGDRYVFVDRYTDNKILVDLYIQSRCAHNIISCSTFSWWGAYLNNNANKKVIYHSPWMKTTKSMDIIPENDNWISYEGF